MRGGEGVKTIIEGHFNARTQREDEYGGWRRKEKERKEFEG